MSHFTSALLTLTAAAAAQSSDVGWVSPSHPPPLVRTGMVYDEARGRLVLYGGRKSHGTNYHDTWEWDGSAWIWRRPSASPTAWEGSGMAYDSARQRSVLFGGRIVNPNNSNTAITDETWEWDGFAWNKHTPQVRPIAREGHAVAFDEVRQRTVLFGGNPVPGLSQPTNDTWLWDGTSWLELQPEERPAPREDHAMVFDRARGVVVLFGGQEGSFPRTEFDDTWEWNGTTWTQLNPPVKPSARYEHSMAYDVARQRVVLFGGTSQSLGITWFRDTWEWDGTTWTLRAQASGPSAEAQHSMAYDAASQRTVLFGGTAQGQPAGEAWEWNGTAWTQRSAPPVEPPGTDAKLVYDTARQRTLMFGSGDPPLAPGATTWEFDGASWQMRSPSTTPPTRFRFGMAWDSARLRAVLFGGDLGSPRADTWEWDGTTWTQRQPATSPPARWGLGMAYDSARSRTVMFGGLGVGYQDDTWEWDGTTWELRHPTVSPSQRLGAGMAYDPDRQVVVLFGGLRIQVNHEDTWEWDGTEWTRRVTDLAPGPRVYPAMTWDASRRRVVLFGGTNYSSSGNVEYDDTWEWDGQNWTAREIEGPRPPARGDAGIAFDAGLQRTVLFGGNPLSGDSFGTWTYGSGLARSTSIDSGCNGTRGRPFLGSFGPPTLGRASFALDLVRARAMAPAVAMVTTESARVLLGGDCALVVSLTSPGLALPSTTTAAGTATFALPLPNAPALRGQELWAQAIVADPLGAWQGHALSGGVRMTLGL